MYIRATLEEDEARFVLKLLDSAMHECASNTAEYSHAEQAQFVIERAIEMAIDRKYFHGR